MKSFSKCFLKYSVLVYKNDPEILELRGKFLTISLRKCNKNKRIYFLETFWLSIIQTIGDISELKQSIFHFWCNILLNSAKKNVSSFREILIFLELLNKQEKSFQSESQHIPYILLVWNSCTASFLFGSIV